VKFFLFFFGESGGEYGEGGDEARGGKWRREADRVRDDKAGSDNGAG